MKINTKTESNMALEKVKVFRQMLEDEGLDLVMEAHSGLAAKIAQQSGFKAIWASGLSISTMLGVRDSNEASWTQALQIVEFMADATNIPIFFDGDSGYGNFNNVRRLVQKLCQRNLAGVAIEDKLFPKTNSFVEAKHQLANIEEFCGRIKAGKDSQLNEHFTIIARTEAFIAGMDVNEALDRANEYVDAGADGIFIHSKKDDPSEIFEFCEKWTNRAPLIIAPTTYCKGSFDEFLGRRISMLICANHSVRASMAAMIAVTKEIIETRTFNSIESKISSISDIFALLEYEELKSAEEKYLP